MIFYESDDEASTGPQESHGRKPCTARGMLAGSGQERSTPNETLNTDNVF